MNPAKVRREHVRKLTDLPNIGPAMARDFALLDIRTPGELAGRDPLQLYRALCRKTGARQDPCVLDVFISVTRFMDGDEPKSWWDYTAERKRCYDI
ncbi:MAG TPA: helix-hairpin-helix domain-containing protein [Rhodanobacteraceae bacterium]|nr:helix-hairpin-helix domain-containing protein [Rhodanobacteraceae bacterium]